MLQAKQGRSGKQVTKPGDGLFMPAIPDQAHPLVRTMAMDNTSFEAGYQSRREARLCLERALPCSFLREENLSSLRTKAPSFLLFRSLLPLVAKVEVSEGGGTSEKWAP